jgi:hypothetical protein
MSTSALQARYAALQSNAQPAASPADPVVVTSALNQALLNLSSATLDAVSGKANSGANSDITSLTGLTTPLSQAQGGLGNGTGDASGLSVKATGATTARTIAARAADVINVKDFGAKCDGSTDDTAAVSAAVAYLLTLPRGAQLAFPAGSDCLLSAAIPVALTGSQRFQLSGPGPHAAKIHFTNPASVGFRITMAPTSQWLPYGPSVAVENVTFIAAYSSASVAGTALSVTQQDPGTGTYARNPYPSVSLRNITWEGSNPNNGFLGGAYLFGTALTQIENVYFWAANGDTASVMLAYDTDAAIPVVVDHFILNPRMHGGGTAIQVGNATTTSNLEGFDVVRPSFTGSVHGIVAQNITGGFGVTGGQINTTQDGIAFLGGVTGGLYVSNVDFIQAGTAHITINGGAATLNIVGNNFLSSGGTAQTAIVLNNLPSSNSNGVLIGNNTFRNFANAPISLTGTTDFVHMTGNINRASATLYTDTTGNGHNTAVDNSLGGKLQPYTVGQPGLAQSFGTLDMYSSGNAASDAQIQVSGGNSSPQQGTIILRSGLVQSFGSFIPQFDIGFQPTYVTTSSTTATVPSFKSQWIYAPGSTTASLTVTLPSFARDGLLLELVFANPVTSLTVSPNSGQSIVGTAVSAASIAASTTVKYYYRSSNSSWYRAQ